MSGSNSKPPWPSTIWQIVLVYALVSALWIFGSDWLVAQIIPGQLQTVIQTFKGLAFIILTSALIFGLLWRELKAREKTEATLRDSEDRFRRLAENAPDMIYRYRLAPSPALEYVSPAIAHITGFSREELFANPNLLAANVYPEDRHLYEQAKTLPVVALRIIHKDGHLVWIEQRHALITDAAGQPVAVEGVARDITALKNAETQLQRYADQLTTINDLGRRLTETFDLPSVFEQLYEAVHRLLPDIADLTINFFDSKAKLLNVAYAVKDGEPQDVQYLPALPLTNDSQSDYPSQVIVSGQPLIVNHPPPPATAAPVPLPAAQTSLYIPLKAKSDVIGLLHVQSYQPNRFTPADADLLTVVGNTAAVAIQNARLFADNIQRLDTLGALYVSAQKMSFARDVQQLVLDVVRTCVQGYGVQLAWLGRAEPDGSIKIMMHYPEQVDYMQSLAVRWDDTPQGQSLSGRAIRTGFPALSPDIASDPTLTAWRTLAELSGLKACMALPLINRDKPYGVLVLYSAESNFFNPQRIAFLQAYAHQVATALENARLVEETDRRLRQMQSLHTIDLAITSSVDLALTLSVVLEQLTIQLGVTAGTVLVYNARASTLDPIAVRGFLAPGLERIKLRLGEGLAGQAALERQAVTVDDLRRHPDVPARQQIFNSDGLVFYYAEPLLSKGQLKGVLEVFSQTQFEPSIEWLDFLETISSQTATAIADVDLFNNLQRTNIELTLAYDATIEGWSRAMDLRDKETQGHTERVTEMAVRLGEQLGLTEDQLTHIRRGALLHDIGKMGVPDHVLLKPGPLTEEEWALMRMHPSYAYEMLSPIAYLQPAIDIPYCHHEKWDGTGYPRGLKGEQIPLAARIFAVVDVWDALRSDRPYRPSWPAAKVREHIISLSGTHFDPKVVNVFARMI
jgi:PAS domain S-box-containing protein